MIRNRYADGQECPWYKEVGDVPTGKSAHGTGHQANGLDESSKVAHVGVQWGM